MRQMRHPHALMVAALLLGLVTASAADTGYNARFPMQTDEKVTVTCDFPLSLVSIAATTVTVLSGTHTNPGAMISTSGVSNFTAFGRPCRVTNSCAALVVDATTATSGNKYQIHIRANTVGGGRLDCDLRLDVDNVVFTP